MWEWIFVVHKIPIDCICIIREGNTTFQAEAAASLIRLVYSSCSGFGAVLLWLKATATHIQISIPLGRRQQP